MKLPKQYRLVCIEWVDIVQRTVKDGERIKAADCVSWGVYDYETDEEIVIITEVSDDDVTKQAFPKGCIKRMREFKVV